MTTVISQHEYSLKPGVTPEAFKRAVHIARQRGLFRLPGLVDYYFLRGLRGARQGEYAAVWIYASREAWEAMWGPVEAPVPHKPTLLRGWSGKTNCYGPCWTGTPTGSP